MSTSVSLWLSPLDSDRDQCFLQQRVRESGGPLFRPHVTLHHFDVQQNELNDVIQKVKSLAASMKTERLDLEFAKVVKGDSFHHSVYLGEPAPTTVTVLTDLKQQVIKAVGAGKGGGVR